MMRRSGEQQVDGVFTRSLTQITWIPIVIMSCILITAASVAIMIVLSLIPTYLTTGDLHINTQYPLQLIVTYRTDLINGSSLTVDNTNAMSISLNNALHLYGIGHINAQFIPLIRYVQNKKTTTAVTKRNDQLRINGKDSMGDLFHLNFSTAYPKYCYTNKCRQRFANKMLFDMTTIYSNFSLPIRFTNNGLFTVDLSFCAFNDYRICQLDGETSGNEEGGTGNHNVTESNQNECPDDDTETCQDENEGCCASDDDEDVRAYLDDLDNEETCQDETEAICEDEN